MELPNKVNILGADYIIKYVENASEVDIDKRSALWGQVDYWTNTIRIFNGLTHKAKWQTVWHEILHAISHEYNIKCLKGEEAHADLDTLSKALSDTLFRNGWLKSE